MCDSNQNGSPSVYSYKIEPYGNNTVAIAELTLGAFPVFAPLIVPREIGGKKVVAIRARVFETVLHRPILIPKTISFIDDNAFGEALWYGHCVLLVYKGSYAHRWAKSVGMDYKFVKRSDEIAPRGQNYIEFDEDSFELSELFTGETERRWFASADNPCVGSTYVPQIPADKDEIDRGFLRRYVAFRSFDVHPENESFSQVDGVLFNKDQSVVICAPENIFFQNGRYVLPYDVVEIENDAFGSCDSLKEIVFSDRLERIGRKAFALCGSLTKAVITANVCSIETDAFSGCSQLKAFEVSPDNPTYGAEDGVLIENGCRIIRYPEGKEDAEYATPDDVVGIEEHAFLLAKFIRVYLSERVFSIGRLAFNSCPNLKEFVVDPNNPCYESFDGALFTAGRSVLIQYPNDKTDKKYAIPEETNFLEDGAFGANPHLVQIDVGDGVDDIGDFVFSYCANLKKIEVSPNNLHYSSINGVLFNFPGTDLLCYPPGRKAKRYRVPEGTMRIVDFAFTNPRYLETIELGEDVTEVESEAFDQISRVKAINVPLQNAAYASFDGVLFTKDMDELVRYPSGKTDMRYYVPRSVRVIRENAFQGNGRVEVVVLQDGVEVIGENAFYGASMLRFVSIPRSVVRIDEGAFDFSAPRIHLYKGSYAEEWMIEHDRPYHIVSEEY